VRLGGLCVADARRLWHLLDELYGAADGFETALGRSGGNPFLLRRGHAGDLSDEDPIGESVAALGPDQRRAAGALALAEVRLPLSLLDQLVQPGTGREVMRGLADKVMVEVHADGSVSMHALVRDALLRALSAGEQSQLHADLARLLPDASLDPARRARAVCRHLRALDRHEEAARYLIERGSELDKYGAAGELLRGLEAIPRDRRTAEASAALARVSARVFDLARAYAEHERLLGSTAEPQVELVLIHALLALVTGRPEVAEHSLGEIERGVELPPALAVRALTIRSLLRLFAGAPGEASELLLAAAERASAGAAQAPLWLYASFALWIEERDAEAYDAIRRALVLRAAGGALSYRSGVLASTMHAVIAACMGRASEAETALHEAELLMAGDEDLLMTTYVGHARACLRVERGDWSEAQPELRLLVDRLHHGGHLLGELMGSALEGRSLVVAGRRRDGLRILEHCRAVAGQRQLPGIERVVERALACDPVRVLERGGASGRQSQQVWSRLVEAIRSAAVGERSRVAVLLAAEAPSLERPGHELGRVLGELAVGVLALAGGDQVAARAHLASARSHAASAGLDDDLVSALLAAVGSLRVVTAAGSRIAPDSDVVIGPDDVCLDARTHELRFGTRRVSLLRRPMLRRLLYRLASGPGATASKDELADALWSREFNPVTDHGPLKSNIANLRKLVEQAGMTIEFDEVGYRLIGTERLLFVVPITWPLP
jgi:hypothetical protein